MNKIVSAVKTFIADENGVTAIEYGLIAALMGAAVVLGIGLVSGGLSSVFTKIGNKLTGVSI
ncbi:MAG: Flp family type IVb pilin [Massilia sp.]|nr:Flp family type IVb pilin [Massilia sp.]